MTKNKLEQVLEYLVAGDEDKAKELIHQVFIEKARAIHEELINADEVSEMEVLGGDEGEDLKHGIHSHSDEIEELSDEIDAEEMMGEDADEITMDIDDAESDLDDTMGDAGALPADLGADADADAGMGDSGDPMSNIEDTMGDLESALAELKAEFEKLEAGAAAGEEAMGDEEEAIGDEEEAEGEADEAEGEEDEAEGEEAEEEMDEAFTESDFDDLAEAIELEKVSVPTGGEVGAGKYSPRDADAKSKSPVPPSQTERFGAKPVKTGTGPHASGYALETPPKSDKTKILPKDNRRKTENQGTENEQSGNYGAKEDSKSALDTTERQFGKGNQTSPLTHAPRK